MRQSSPPRCANCSHTQYCRDASESQPYKYQGFDMSKRIRHNLPVRGARTGHAMALAFYGGYTRDVVDGLAAMAEVDRLAQADVPDAERQRRERIERLESELALLKSQQPAA